MQARSIKILIVINTPIIIIVQEFSPLSPAPLTSSRSMDWGPGFEDQHDNITISRLVKGDQAMLTKTIADRDPPA